MSEADRAALRLHLEPVSLERRRVLIRPSEPITHVYFPESGLASVVGRVEDREIEIGIVGREGMTGIPLALGSDRTPHECYMQIAGEGWRIEAALFRQVLGASPSLRALIQGYVQAFLIQVAETAVSNGMLTIEQRLARWLLMCQVRTGLDDLPLTHEFLAIMLGVQRPGVTIAIQMLEGSGLVKARRGRISLRDAGKLEAVAGSGYGLPEAEYLRLVGTL
jgi:CRP-like cAMP-binding protein